MYHRMAEARIKSGRFSDAFSMLQRAQYVPSIFLLYGGQKLTSLLMDFGLVGTIIKLCVYSAEAC